MIYKEEFTKFNSEINPFEDGTNVVTVFMEGRRKLTPEVKYLIFNEARKSSLSYYYGMSAQNTQLAKENGLRFIFSDYKSGLTSVKMLQELCGFKTVCYGELPVLVVMDFTLADSTCATHAFIKGIKRAVNDIRRMNIGIKMLFIMPSRSPFKVTHDLWLVNNDKGLIRKVSKDEVFTFNCNEEAVNEMRTSLIFRNAFNDLAYIGVDAIDISNFMGIKGTVADWSYKFDDYYEVS